MVSTVSTIVGVVMGVIGTICVAWIKGKFDHKKELMKYAIETAHRDFDAAIKLKIEKVPEQKLYPMSAYISYHYQFIHHLNNGFSPDSAARHTLSAMEKLMKVYEESSIKTYKDDWTTS
jgi:hypothetical protein